MISSVLRSSGIAKRALFQNNALYTKYITIRAIQSVFNPDIELPKRLERVLEETKTGNEKNLLNRLEIQGREDIVKDFYNAEEEQRVQFLARLCKNAMTADDNLKNEPVKIVDKLLYTNSVSEGKSHLASGPLKQIFENDNGTLNFFLSSKYISTFKVFHKFCLDLRGDDQKRYFETLVKGLNHGNELDELRIDFIQRFFSFFYLETQLEVIQLFLKNIEAFKSHPKKFKHNIAYTAYKFPRINPIFKDYDPVTKLFTALSADVEAKKVIELDNFNLEKDLTREMLTDTEEETYLRIVFNRIQPKNYKVSETLSLLKLIETELQTSSPDTHYLLVYHLINIFKSTNFELAEDRTSETVVNVLKDILKNNIRSFLTDTKSYNALKRLIAGLPYRYQTTYSPIIIETCLKIAQEENVSEAIFKQSTFLFRATIDRFMESNLYTLPFLKVMLKNIDFIINLRFSHHLIHYSIKPEKLVTLKKLDVLKFTLEEEHLVEKLLFYFVRNGVKFVNLMLNEKDEVVEFSRNQQELDKEKREREDIELNDYRDILHTRIQSFIEEDNENENAELANVAKSYELANS